MTCRNELRGIAAGIAGKFISRNNDIDGYWAMGILYKAVTEKDSNKLKINLIQNKSIPDIPFINETIKNYHSYLLQQINKKGFEESQVSGAIIDIEFNASPTKKHIWFKYTWGEPFICIVTLVDDMSKKHSYEAIGWCGKHDPKNERRSARKAL